jgi:hypothetical protein
LWQLAQAEASMARATKTTRLKEKIAKLKEEMQRLGALDVRMLATPEQQISLTDPDARSMATSGRGSGVVGYNVHGSIQCERQLCRSCTYDNIRALGAEDDGVPILPSNSQ